MAAEYIPFSENLRVLVVDDDPVCVKIISQMLKHCHYQVTEVAKATEALETLKKNPKSFDMMITDTYNDMDVLTLIVDIMKIENIPVILVSGLEDTSTLIKGVLQGADEIISKPVSLAKVKTLWQHVYRRRLMNANSEVEDMSKSLVNYVDDSGPSSSSKNDDDNEEVNGDESEPKKKKMRVRWHGSLQEKFTQAVIQLGGPVKAMPKKIMEMMNAPEISRESVASHLQKYRRQNKPLVLKNDKIGVVSTQSHYNTIPGSSHSCYRHNIKTIPRFGYNHHHHHHHNPVPRIHHQQHSSCQYGSRFVNGYNLPTRMSTGYNPSFTPSFNSSCSWTVPKVENNVFTPQLPDREQFMLPPVPQMTAQPIPVAPTAGTNLPALPQANPIATDHSDNNFASGNPFMFDDAVFDDEFLADLFNGTQEGLDQWMQGTAGDGAAGPSGQQYS